MGVFSGRFSMAFFFEEKNKFRIFFYILFLHRLIPSLVITRGFSNFS